MFKNKIKKENVIIIPKSKEDTHNLTNNVKLSSHNKNYENIRNLVQNENENVKNLNQKEIKNKFNIV